MLIPIAVYGQTATIDKTQLSNGVINVSYKSSEDKKTKVMVSKGSDKYTYDLKSEGQYPLQFGNGDYTVSILENASGNQYKVVTQETLKFSANNINAVYLQSIDMINWDNNMKAIKIAKELTKGLNTDKEKATVLYNYVAKNIKYDYNKAATVVAGYIPSIDATLNTSLGICFDYSVVYAAMMRSVGVPTKVIMGQNIDIKEYHAWNEVYLSESNQWVTIDTTYDAPSIQKGIPTAMIKNISDYTTEKQY
ncbi:MAG TPA: transglutaminase domain-containing protein [Epulopiscium sp.]|nr:transglutaminase domain-containing protein [Candidatus Epulonipiscium sp.]